MYFAICGRKLTGLVPDKQVGELLTEASFSSTDLSYCADNFLGQLVVGNKPARSRLKSLLRRMPPVAH